MTAKPEPPTCPWCGSEMTTGGVLADPVTGELAAHCDNLSCGARGPIGINDEAAIALAAARRAPSAVAEAERACADASLGLRKAQLSIVATTRTVGCMEIPSEEEAREHGDATRAWRDACAALERARKEGGA